jgi:hypothetical protein
MDGWARQYVERAPFLPDRVSELGIPRRLSIFLGRSRRGGSFWVEKISTLLIDEL